MYLFVYLSIDIERSICESIYLSMYLSFFLSEAIYPASKSCHKLRFGPPLARRILTLGSPSLDLPARLSKRFFSPFLFVIGVFSCSTAFPSLLLLVSSLMMVSECLLLVASCCFCNDLRSVGLRGCGTSESHAALFCGQLKLFPGRAVFKGLGQSSLQ